MRNVKKNKSRNYKIEERLLKREQNNEQNEGQLKIKKKFNVRNKMKLGET